MKEKAVDVHATGRLNHQPKKRWWWQEEDHCHLVLQGAPLFLSHHKNARNSNDHLCWHCDTIVAWRQAIQLHQNCLTPRSSGVNWSFFDFVSSCSVSKADIWMRFLTDDNIDVLKIGMLLKWAFLSWLGTFSTLVKIKCSVVWSPKTCGVQIWQSSLKQSNHVAQNFLAFVGMFDGPAHRGFARLPFLCMFQCVLFSDFCKIGQHHFFGNCSCALWCSSKSKLPIEQIDTGLSMTFCELMQQRQDWSHFPCNFVCQTVLKTTFVFEFRFCPTWHISFSFVTFNIWIGCAHFQQWNSCLPFLVSFVWFVLSVRVPFNLHQQSPHSLPAARILHVWLWIHHCVHR